MRSCDGLYQLEIADFRGKTPQRELEDAGNAIAPLRMYNGRLGKLVDLPLAAPTRTILRRAKSNKAAKRMGEKLGTVIACFKVDKLPYLVNVEHTRLEPQTPVVIDIKAEDFTINRNLEISRPTRRSGYNVVIDKT